jgi:hypothetical protein
MKLRSLTRNTAGLCRGWDGRRDRGEGRRQRAIRRLLIAANGASVTGREMMQAIYSRGEPWTEWRWRDVRASARRWAVPVLEPRSRPLRWRAKPDLLLWQQLAKNDQTP